MIRIGKKVIDNFRRPYIIAEIGANHNGSIALAKKLIREASSAGCDAVKFQSWTKETIFSSQFYKEHSADRDKNFGDRNLEEMIELFQLSKDAHAGLFACARENNIEFLSTPFSNQEVDLLDRLGVKAFKIASMDLNNYGFIEYIASKQKPVILSTGLSSLTEIKNAVSVVRRAGNKKLILMHCVAVYPPKEDAINLYNIDMLRDLFHIPIGFSDHSIGIITALAAVARGASVIERHFTLDRSMPGWDHAISSDPEEMAELVKESKKVSLALGRYDRILSKEEEVKKKSFRRSIVAANNIRKGQIIKKADLDYKRPGTGFEPEYSAQIINKKARRDIGKDQLIRVGDF